MMKACVTCEKTDSPYKCPICRVTYCSVDCFKKHKTIGCSPPETTNESKNEPTDKPKLVYRYPTEDTVPIEKLELLRHSDQVKLCMNNPHVRTIVQGILDSDDPTEAIAQAMTEPIFVELADACLQVVEPPDEPETREP